MSNRRLILWLFVVSLSAIVVNLFLSWRAPERGFLARKILIDHQFDPSEIVIERPDEAQIVLKKQEGQWMMSAPYSGAIDAHPVIRLLDEVMFSRIEDSLSESEIVKLGRCRGDFGLKTPRLKVSFANSRETISFSFGHETAMADGVYVTRGESDPICVVSSAVYKAADLKSDSLRERVVFPYSSEFITSFDIKRSDAQRLSFTRNDTGWLVGNRAASVPRVEEFLNTLSETSAIDFIWPVGGVNEPQIASAALLSGYGLDTDSALVITLHCQDGEDRRILIGHDTSTAKTYALIHGGAAVVTIPPSLKSAAMRGAHSFTDSRLFPLDESAVMSFAISDGAISYVAARETGGAWRLDSPVSGPADPEVASGMLGRLLALTQADADSSGLKVTVSTNQQSYTVSSASVITRGRLDDLRSKDILKIDPTLVRRLVSTSAANSGRPVSIVRQQDKRTWTVETESLMYNQVREHQVESILSALKTLTASKVVMLRPSAADLMRFGLETPLCTLAVDQEKGDAVRRNILIGAQTQGGRYVTVGSSEAVFVLPTRVADVLMAPLVDEKH